MRLLCLQNPSEGLITVDTVDAISDVSSCAWDVLDEVDEEGCAVEDINVSDGVGLPPGTTTTLLCSEDDFLLLECIEGVEEGKLGPENRVDTLEDVIDGDELETSAAWDVNWSV